MKKNIKNFSEYVSESEDGNVKKFNKLKDKTNKENSKTNIEVYPESDKDKDPNYDIVFSKKLEIGDNNSVEKFKEWNRNARKNLNCTDTM